MAALEAEAVEDCRLDYKNNDWIDLVEQAYLELPSNTIAVPGNFGSKMIEKPTTSKHDFDFDWIDDIRPPVAET